MRHKKENVSPQDFCLNLTPEELEALREVNTKFATDHAEVRSLATKGLVELLGPYSKDILER
jgi:hypothetical protein